MMRNAVAAALLAVAFATPVAAQVPNVQQLLKGLTSGNQNQDQAMRDAFERGYQRGRQDEARLQRSGHAGGDANRFDQRGLDNRNSRNLGGDGQDYRNGQGSGQTQGNQDYGR